MTVPDGSTANVVLPLTSSQKVEISEKQLGKIEPGQIKGLETGQFKLGAGDYLITVAD